MADLHTWRLPRARALALLTLAALWAFIAPLSAPATAGDPKPADPQADPAEEPEEPKSAGAPLVTICVASADRVMSDIDYLFQTIDRPDMTEVVQGLLGNVNDLDGLERTKPAGVMLFLKPGVAPQPVPVAFIPTSNINELIETIEVAPVQVRAIEGEQGRYEVLDTPQPTELLVRGGYSFIANDREVLDLELPDPSRLCGPLAAKYDLAVSVDIASIPDGMRTLFLDLLRAQTEVELQQRDGEPDSAHKARRAAGINNLELLEDILTEGRRFVFGVDASREQKVVHIDFNLEAAPDSAFAEHLTNFGGQASRFAAAHSETSPMLLSAALTLDKSDRKTIIAALDAARAEIERRGEASERPVNPAALEDVFGPLKDTVQAGELDLFVTFKGRPPGPFVFVGGVDVRRSDDLANGLSRLLRELEERLDLENLNLNIATHDGVRLHRLVGKDSSPGEERIYGGKPSFYVGAGRDALWFAAGGEAALTNLKQTIDAVAEAKPPEKAAASNAPFHLVVNLSQWLGLPQGEGRRGQRFRERARAAFAAGGDRLEIEARPTENGVRLRLRLEEGFLRMLGLSITERYDRSQL